MKSSASEPGLKAIIISMALHFVLLETEAWDKLKMTYYLFTGVNCKCFDMICSELASWKKRVNPIFLSDVLRVS